jgi:alkylated DNA nucleotide flippase Atl1
VVVIEIKRDQSGRGQDLQAIRYAAYASTIGAEDLARLFQDYRLREHKEKLSPEEARSELEEFVLDETFTLDDLDEDESPRMALVARHFHPGVTATALWLNRNFEFSISCVQIVPYRVEEKIVLASTVLIPLPEAADYEVRLQKKRRRASAKKKTIPLDYEAAREFIDSIPTGRWASYGDVAAAAGNRLAGQPIGSWLMREDIDVPHVYRVLTRHGHASPSWKAKHPDLPATPEAVHERLAQEGVEFDEQGRASQAHRWSPDGTG